MVPSIWLVSTSLSALAVEPSARTASIASHLTATRERMRMVLGKGDTLAGIIDLLRQPRIRKHTLTGVGRSLFGMALHHAIEVELDRLLGFQIGLHLLHDGHRARLDGVLAVGAGHSPRDRRQV